MKAIKLESATQSLEEYIDETQDGTVIFTRRGKPVAALVSAKGMDAESIALANSPEFVNIINRSRRRQEAEGGFTVAEVRRQLRLPQKRSRKKRAS